MCVSPSCGKSPEPSGSSSAGSEEHLSKGRPGFSFQGGKAHVQILKLNLYEKGRFPAVPCEGGKERHGNIEGFTGSLSSFPSRGIKGPARNASLICVIRPPRLPMEAPQFSAVRLTRLTLDFMFPLLRIRPRQKFQDELGAIRIISL